MKLTLVVLAAGAGTRYGGLKQLAPIGPAGETLLEYSIFDARRAGFDRVVVVVRRGSEAEFRRELDRRAARHLPIAYAHQEPDVLPAGSTRPAERDKPWGTGQAILAAGIGIEGPFAVVNADDFYGETSYVTLADHLRSSRGPNDLAVVGFRVEGTLTAAGPVSRALLEIDANRRLRRIVEMPEVWSRDGRILARHEGRELALTGDELVSMNMWGFTPSLLPALRDAFSAFLERDGSSADAEFLLPEAIEALVRAESFCVDVLPGGGDWCGLTFRADLERARAMIASLVTRGRYPDDLWA